MSTKVSTRIRDALVSAAENDARTNGDAGSLNDLLGALVSTQAIYLAAIPNDTLRQSMMAQMAKMLAEEVDLNRKSGGGPKVQTIVMPERSN
jgi:hypothetical protein